METTLEAKINEMGLGLGSKPSRGKDKPDSAEQSIIEVILIYYIGLSKDYVHYLATLR